MKPSELYKNNYNELSEMARTIIETSDQFFDDFAGDFQNAEQFNEFIVENYAE